MHTKSHSKKPVPAAQKKKKPVVVLLTKKEARKLFGRDKKTHDDQRLVIRKQVHYSYKVTSLEKVKKTFNDRKGYPVRSTKYGLRRAFAEPAKLKRPADETADKTASEASKKPRLSLSESFMENYDQKSIDLIPFFKAFTSAPGKIKGKITSAFADWKRENRVKTLRDLRTSHFEEKQEKAKSKRTETEKQLEDVYAAMFPDSTNTTKFNELKRFVTSDPTGQFKVKFLKKGPFNAENTKFLKDAFEAYLKRIARNAKIKKPKQGEKK